MRADFKVGSTLVEYFGLAGDANYDAKIELKRSMAAKHRFTITEVYPADLADTTELVIRLAGDCRKALHPALRSRARDSGTRRRRAPSFPVSCSRCPAAAGCGRGRRGTARGRSRR
jgi:hypothetical protein